MGCVILDKISGGMENENYKCGGTPSHHISPPNFNHWMATINF